MDIRAGDRVFYLTTCGWMMWNWLVAALASGASIVLYDGNPFYPSPTRLFDLIDQDQITLLGVSAKLIARAPTSRHPTPATPMASKPSAPSAPPDRPSLLKASSGCTNT